MKHCYLSALLFLFISGHLPAQDSIAKFKIRKEKELSTGIKIQVQRFETRAALENAKVTVRLLGIGEFVVYSDSEGMLDRISAAPGTYNVNISVDGYVSREVRHVVVGEGKTAYVSFPLQTIEEAKAMQGKKRGKNKRRSSAGIP